jgi:hypothetical protein
LSVVAALHSSPEKTNNTFLLLFCLAKQLRSKTASCLAKQLLRKKGKKQKSIVISEFFARVQKFQHMVIFN